MASVKKIVSWRLTDLVSGKEYPAQVPGDITMDLYRAGEIADPNYAMNFQDVKWITERDFAYTGTFTITEADYAYENISLVAKGVDTFADIYINGKHLCHTENMFLEYRPEMKNLVHVGENTIRVEMHSTRKIMDQVDTGDYYGIFNLPRVMIRKAQCQFGWDWGPDMCAYGIWEDMYISCENAQRIDNVYYEAYNTGDVTLFAELNYCTKPMVDYYGKPIEGTCTPAMEDELEYIVTDASGKVLDSGKRALIGTKNFLTLHVENPQLWWPNGYGEQPLYRYKVILYRGGKAVSQQAGQFAFREIKLVQKPLGKERIGFALYVNGKEIYCRGSNWVPVDCFTGTATKEKYEQLIKLAKHGNMNMLRIWGGGVYEKDAFYEACDREGIMIWQDFMFSCAHIPEGDADWVKLTIEECKYQMKRLRLHPSIVLWCGGNEIIGGFGRQKYYGKEFVNFTLRGLVEYYDRTRPYVDQSPCAMTDLGRDTFTGDTHASALEKTLYTGVDDYRQYMTKVEAGFYSESALIGPCSLESFHKFLPEDKRWPINEVWEAHLTRNPYAGKQETFSQRLCIHATEMYGTPKSLEDLVAKGGLLHAEFLRAESDYARTRIGECTGYMNWMYSDVWPTATWASVDYFCEPKQGYYTQRQSYAPRCCLFVQEKDKAERLYIVNETLQEAKCKLTYGAKTLDGKVLWSTVFEGTLGENEKISLPIGETDKNTYLFSKGTIGGTPVKTLYSVDFWRSFQFESDYTYTVKQVSEKQVEVMVKANRFVKSLFISMPDNYKYLYSDNYIDVEAGEKVTVVITSDEAIDPGKLSLQDYATITK